MKRALYLSGAAGLLAGGYLLGSITLGGALAQTPSHTPTQTQTQQPAPAASQGQTEAQDPAYGSSVATAQDQAGQNETGEAQALAGKAKITSDQAKAAALVQFPGATIQKVGLENENGSVVYGVQLSDASGKAQDVKVDAGTGKVLNVQAGGADGPDAGGQETAGTED